MIDLDRAGCTDLEASGRREWLVTNGAMGCASGTVAGRPETARRILGTFASFIDIDMLPNRFADEGQVPEYNTVDAALWFFEALRR